MVFLVLILLYFSSLIAVLRQDREENVEVALKILRLLTPPAQSSRHRILLQFSQQIASACQSFIQGPRPGEDGAPHQGPNDLAPNEQYGAITRCSVRLIPLVCLCEFRMPKVPLYTR